MCAKLFTAVLGGVLVLPVVPAASQERGFEKSAHVATHKRDRYAVRTFGPRSQYARIAVRALFDSCWRYREISTGRSRELERIWTCGNYVKPNADFDWGYGTSIADQSGRYGYW
jgi:hypothetical protein